MYYEYWGLTRQAFDNVPDPTMYFRAHESVETAVAEVLFAIEEGDECLAVIVGEVGLGKTTSLRVVLDSLDHGKYRIAFVTNPDLTFTMLLREIIGQLKGETCQTKRKDDLLEEFNRLLFATADEGKRVLIFIDEGNAFKSANLESLRLLTNMQMDDRNLFTIVLAGQPKLAKMLEAPRHANLFQRVGVYCRLEKMPSWEVVRDYIDHRLERAGCTRRIFTDDAMRALFDYSEHGVPRLVNKIAKLAMKAGETNALAEIGPDVVSAIGERFKRFTKFAAKSAKKDKVDVGAEAAAAVEPQEELLMPVEPEGFAEGASADAHVEMAAEPSAPEPAVEGAPDASVPDREPVYAQAAAETTPRFGAAEAEPSDGDNGNGGNGDDGALSLTRVCLDEALRPEILERVRSADRVERIKMAGQLAAEQIKRHPEVVTQKGDPVVTWKELRNEILSAFSAEGNS